MLLAPRLAFLRADYHSLRIPRFQTGLSGNQGSRLLRLLRLPILQPDIPSKRLLKQFLKPNKKTELTVTKHDDNGCRVTFKYFQLNNRQTDRGTFRGELLSKTAKSFESQLPDISSLKQEEERADDQICQLVFQEVQVALT